MTRVAWLALLCVLTVAANAANATDAEPESAGGFTAKLPQGDYSMDVTAARITLAVRAPPYMGGRLSGGDLTLLNQRSRSPH